MTEQNIELNNVRPSSLNHLVGQKSVIEQTRIAVNASFADHKAVDHAMFVGPPGVGKTQLAQVVAEELAVDFYEVLGQTLSTPTKLNNLLMNAKPNGIIFIDEAHEIPKAQQTALYLALDQKRVIVSDRYTHSTAPLNDFSLFLATTDEYRVLQPLRDRMRLVLRFQFYSPEELAVIVRQRARALGWVIDEEIPFRIAERGRGTPRLALRLLQACRRVCRSDEAEVIIMEHFERACQLEEIDSIGLGPVDKRYLTLLADGPLQVNVLASRLGLPKMTISTVTEPYLLRSELIVKDQNGRRQLTRKGEQHLLRLDC